MTAEGSVASTLVGAVTVVTWTQLTPPLEILGAMPWAEASPFLYELVGVSLLTTPPRGVDAPDAGVDDGD